MTKYRHINRKGISQEDSVLYHWTRALSLRCGMLLCRQIHLQVGYLTT